MRVPESILQPNHPSYGCDQAWFVFGVLNPSGNITRVLIVEAKNTWAVQTLERVAGNDNKVNDHCELMTVGRNCSSIGTRSDKAVEVSYIDFILDIVEPGRLLEDYYISTTFDRSLTDEDRKYAAKKLEEMNEASQESVETKEPDPVFVPKAECFNDKPIIRHKSISALLDLGFKKQQVNNIIDEVGVQNTVEETVKSALQRLYAA